ncbi:MAG: TetR/AcrR family transcriptional regulator, partial [Hyphomicrobiales bacterium]
MGTPSRTSRAKPAKKAAARPRRRKNDRPEEIVSAALEEFAAKGFAATRLEDVAARARVSKGLPYLYFRTKEELFKAVIKTFVKPGFDSMIEDIRDTRLSSEDFLRGPFLDFFKAFV